MGGGILPGNFEIRQKRFVCKSSFQIEGGLDLVLMIFGR